MKRWVVVLGAVGVVVACASDDEPSSGAAGGPAGAGHAGGSPVAGSGGHPGAGAGAAAGEGGDRSAGGGQAATGARGGSGGHGNTAGADSNAGAAGASAGAAGSDGCPAGASGARPSDYLAAYRSGTRLQVMVTRAAGMPDVFAGFFDSEFGVPCDFVLASDDELRCLPRSAALAGQLGFADDACGEPVWDEPASCAAATAYVRNRLECHDKYAVSALEPYPDSAVFAGSSGNCQGGQSFSSAHPVVAGAPLAPSSFVKGTRVILPGVCRATLIAVDAEDGARGPFALGDVASGIACWGEAGPCNAVNKAYEETLYTDDACTRDASYATWTDAASCRPPELIRLGSNTPSYAHAGPAATRPLYSNIGQNGCVPALDQAWIGSVYSLGAPVADGELETASELELGTGRLRAAAAGEDGTPIIASTTELWDDDEGSRCTVFRFTDGSLRCVRWDSLSGPAPAEFDDADCTVPLRFCSDVAGSCAGELLLETTTDPSSCESELPVAAAFTLGALATGYYVKSGANCVAAGDVPTDRYVATPVPFSTFPSVERVTLP